MSSNANAVIESEESLTTSASRLPFWRVALGALLMVLGLFLVYLPILPGNFVMDDRKLIEWDNPLVTGKLGIFSIWFRADFPLSTLTFWLERLAWRQSPGGYHVVNIALHALSAFLVWRLLKRLRMPGASLAAALFALHPVCVASVARIAELKNTLSLPFFLLSWIFYLRYEAITLYPENADKAAERPERRSGTFCYTAALVMFVLALLSKTSTVMLPLVLLACAAWQRRKIIRTDLLHVAPFMILSAGFGAMSVWFQKFQALADQTIEPHSFAERLLMASRIFWFYLGKALLPLKLNLVYPRWTMDPARMSSYLALAAAVAAFAFCWRFRRGAGRHALFCIGGFALTLFPALGFFDSQFLGVWQVSDHLQYLSLIFPLALAAAAICSVPKFNVIHWAPAPLLLLAGILTCQRAGVYSNQEALLRDTLSKNGQAWAAHNDLGCLLAQRQQVTEARGHFAAALETNPRFEDAHANLGQALFLEGSFAEAEKHFNTALTIKPHRAETHRRLAACLTRRGQMPEAVLHLRSAILYAPDAQTHLELAAMLYQGRQPREAVAQIHKALRFKQDMPDALNNLAWILSTSPDNSVRDGTEAIAYAKQACRLTGFKNSGMLSTLAAAYAEAGRFPEAVATAERALKMQTAAREERLAGISRQLLTLYQSGKPWHEAVAVNDAP